jgi:hypothetical protein
MYRVGTALLLDRALPWRTVKRRTSMLSVGTIGPGRYVDHIIYKPRNRIGMRRRGGLRHPARLKATAFQ